jgi:uracil-DNA glycosylase
MANGSGQQASLFAESGPVAPQAPALEAWQPDRWPVAPDWKPVTDPFFAGATGRALGGFVTQRLAGGAVIYPPQPLRALELTPLARVRVVILGQDPYHGPGQAEGLAFSVAPGVAMPPSLRNIFKELAREAAQAHPGRGPLPLPADGSLARWARQGVLLLNACLTVEQGQPASHAGRGWEVLSDAIVQAVLDAGNPVVFMLWGAHAQKMDARIRAATGLRLVLTANHPSPLSALRPPRPFIGCGHFEQANAFLRKSGETAVRW